MSFIGIGGSEKRDDISAVWMVLGDSDLVCLHISDNTQLVILALYQNKIFIPGMPAPIKWDEFGAIFI